MNHCRSGRRFFRVEFLNENDNILSQFCTNKFHCNDDFCLSSGVTTRTWVMIVTHTYKSEVMFRAHTLYSPTVDGSHHTQHTFDTGYNMREYNSLFINVILCLWGYVCSSVTESWRRHRKLTLSRNVQLSVISYFVHAPPKYRTLMGGFYNNLPSPIDATTEFQEFLNFFFVCKARPVWITELKINSAT